MFAYCNGAKEKKITILKEILELVGVEVGEVVTLPYEGKF